MKYLGIHKIIWFVLVLLYTILEIIPIYTYWLLYLIWYFKPCKHKNLWKIYHTEDWIENHWGGYAYSDNNIVETIIRRYKRTFE